MKEMRAASIALAAYFAISAEAISMKRSRDGSRKEYSAVRSSRDSGESVPNTTRSGSKKSRRAAPSRRNSGLDAIDRAKLTERFLSSSAIQPRTLAFVPTGTVDLTTASRLPLIARPTPRAALST